MELKEAIVKRKAVRGFTDQPVSRETLKNVLELATRAVSAVNVQPWKFAVLTGDALKAVSEENVACRVDEGGAALPILNVDIRGIGFCPQFLQPLRVRLGGGQHELFHGVLVLRPQQVRDAARCERQEQDEANDNQGFFHADSNLPRWRTHRGRER